MPYRLRDGLCGVRCEDWQEISSQAIYVFGQGYLGKDAQTMGRLKLVCKGWQTALQQADAQFSVNLSNPNMQKLASFAEWYAQHSSLVAELDIYCSPTDPGLHAASASLIATALLAAAGGTARSYGGARLRGLSLKGFRCNILSSPGALAVLPGNSLTRLQLQIPYDAQHLVSKAAEHLNALTNLQQLSFMTESTPPGHIPKRRSSNWLTCLTGLSRLTSLATDWLCNKLDPVMLPPQLQQLTLMCCEDARAEQSAPNLHLTHLTALKKCSIDWCWVSMFSTGLPHQLETLALKAANRCWDGVLTFGLTTLQHLSKLTLDSTIDTEAQLSQLTGISSLTDLSIRYDGDPATLWDSVDCWEELTCLKRLELANMPSLASYEDWEQLMESVAAATSLTCLVLNNVSPNPEPGDPLYRVCYHLRSLKQLQCFAFALDGSQSMQQLYRPGDAMHLSTLTALTHLQFDLHGWTQGVGDYAAASLVCELTNLEVLKLSGCGLTSWGIVPSLQKLARLRQLDLSDNHFAGGIDVWEAAFVSLSSHQCLQGVNVTGIPAHPAEALKTLRSQLGLA